MYLLDTNVISELRKAGDRKADQNVMAWFSEIDATHCFISALTLMELEIGILRVERRDPTQGARLRTWFDAHVLPEFAERTLPVDVSVALRCARLHVPDPRSERDALIAATAMVHGMTVVTRNVTDFEPLGSQVLNPWSGQSGRLQGAKGKKRS
ncbi:type II toxin-antitoxin system VapC family toxin [Luteimonas sp. BDR2-5]|uniref:type II toxin-antitoxin system VapC family toxin n=1 Tax=Proluteimonas luteida TaxID=2878685 RepID=UPI001E2E747F|nr:type II toxin-antitoxin system VapC family toxin [Luteimonas sp. BDR2-5]MCD9026695.1 type II toxin-antitoxin system VapC family toxin [Luteimonas sp. BDR2-5]